MNTSLYSTYVVQFSGEVGEEGRVAARSVPKRDAAVVWGSPPGRLAGSS